MPSTLTAIAACTTTLLGAFIAVRPFYGVALTRWDSWISPRVGRWFDLAGALGLMFAMLGWFVPRTPVWFGGWLVAVALGAGLGVLATRRAAHRHDTVTTNREAPEHSTRREQTQA